LKQEKHLKIILNSNLLRLGAVKSLQQKGQTELVHIYQQPD